MKQLIHNEHKILIYDSIGELPIERFQAFNKYLLLDSGIGSDFNAINQRLHSLSRLIGTDRKNDALKEIANLSQAINFIIANVSPEMYAFVCLCRQIDGKDITDLSDEGIKSTLSMLNKIEIPNNILTRWLYGAKKKLRKKSSYISRNFPTHQI